MDGSVTISLKAFDELRTAHDIANTRDKNLKRAAREIEVFLSFLCTREHILEFVEEFNTQSTKSRINIEDGKVKIVIKDE
jgi:hypothetical protein|tara:strand:+ start:445 stop:684 length:240 start_codon:yes stop_codon:yes gene_type:complete